MLSSGLEAHPDQEEDYRFLHSMLREKKIHLLFKIHERLKLFEKKRPIPVQEHATDLASKLMEELLHQGCRDEVTELVAILSKPHLKSLLAVHDAVAQRDYEPMLLPVPDDFVADEEDSVKIVSMVKTKEPLGATIKRDESTGAIVVARIMKGGAADKSGLIHEGDELKEVNGVSMEHRKPKEILPLLARSKGEVTFKIIPAFYKEEVSSQRKQLFVRALFDYNPEEDPTVPCKEAAVGFRRGDILQIVSLEDETWWQARHHGDGQSRAGLIPSQQLHERRVALQRPRALFKPRTPKAPGDLQHVTSILEDVDYRAITGFHIAGLRRSFRLGRKGSVARETARSRRWSAGVHGTIRPPTYVEVFPYHRLSTDRHRLVVLVGPSGVGVSELKKRLLISDPDRYAVTVPYTTRERRQQETDAVDYHYVPLHKFEEDILHHRFIEYGRYKGYYYGSSLESVNRVLADGKVCLLDMHPSNIKRVYTREYRPFVVFVKPPRIEELRLTRRRAKFICEEEHKNPVRTFTEEDFEEMLDSCESMEREYGHLFEKVLVNGDIAVAFRELKSVVLRMTEAEVQWVPTEWVCPSPTTARRSCSHLTGWI
ncbi:MAGUK p55 subfamily member 7-like [Boleophthalmus pectinirostris]|uniref:MAGUK p55 subfamily member 7-like n=1 Tax=Boleophthalmus pectinirostris TaxID=150288 RepID=UPI000A1C2576|nr:MAGUK p55 subfamily member 7-like [Boleophthalmus pectinirostris]